MSDQEPMRIKRLLDQLLAARAHRDAEPRWSARWHAFDAEMHAIERAVFGGDDRARLRVDRAG